MTSSRHGVFAAVSAALVAGAAWIQFSPSLRAQEAAVPSTQPAVAEVGTPGDNSLAGRLKPRPESTPEEYAKLAAELRATYQKPPSEWPKPDLDPDVEHREIGLMPPVVHPADNAYSKAKSELGRTLFYDPRLSGTGQMSCVSCHDPDLGWGDGRRVSFGHKVQQLQRNTPTILNSAYSTVLFWDGRAASLEEQALGPIGNPNEMHGDVHEVSARIAAVPEYKAMFKEAFGSEEITPENIGKAIACFERTIIAGSSKFDYFLKGRPNALNDSAIRGLHLYRTAARCMNCHSGPEMSDHKFHNIGISHYGKPGLEDKGRYNITKKPEDMGAFKTPGLRNVTRSAPYMHHGRFDLSEVVHLYNGGGFNMRRPKALANDPLFPVKSKHLKVLNLNDQDLEDLQAFLRSLEEPRTTFRVPKVPGMSNAPEAKEENGG
jgi:cytochrome c peroxidase